MKNTIWSPLLYDKLAKLVKKGLSAKDIAAELGLTKGMVIGKIHRSPSLQLAGNNGRPLIKPKKPPNPPKVKREKSVDNIFPFTPPMPHIAAPAIVFTGKPVKFAETNRFMCKFAISGDTAENYMFCGNRVYKRSFCKHHFDICYLTARHANLTA